MPRNAKRKKLNPPGAPAAAPEIPSGPPPPAVVPGEQPFNRATERANEPITAGSPTGRGPGPDRSPQRSRDAAILFRSLQNLPDASPETLVAFLRARGDERLRMAQRGV